MIDGLPKRRRARSSRSTEYRALAEFRHQVRNFLNFSEENARAAGVEPQQHQLLLALKGLPEGQRPTMRALADRLRLKHHTVVGLVDRLEARNLVVRRKSEVDGREILIETTLEGERLLRKLTDVHMTELAVAGPALVRALEAIVGKPRRARTRKGQR
jgi:DNA-binding MarR family transcriptional regulator